MTRRAPLPKITECVEKQNRTEWISASTLLQAAYPFLIICALCLAHIHLEFQRTDMKMQQSRLQVQQRQLVREEGTLHRQNEELCDPELLEIHARRDLGMEKLQNPKKELVVTISRDVQEKYSKPGTPDERAVAMAQMKQDRTERRIQNRVLAFLDVNSANAANLNGR